MTLCFLLRFIGPLFLFPSAFHALFLGFGALRYQTTCGLIAIIESLDILTWLYMFALLPRCHRLYLPVPYVPISVYKALLTRLCYFHSILSRTIRRTCNRVLPTPVKIDIESTPCAYTQHQRPRRLDVDSISDLMERFDPSTTAPPSQLIRSHAQSLQSP